MVEQKLHLFIRTSLVAPLIGKSQYSKDYEAFIKLLNMNKYCIYNDNDEFHNIFNITSDYENKIIKKKYNNINELQKSLIEIQNFIYPNSILEKYKKYMICTFGKLNEYLVLNKYLEINNIINNEQESNFKSIIIFDSDYFDITLTGKPDYIIDNNIIIEIKNRVHTFSKCIKDCDLVQLQLYLNMYNIEIGKLVEGMVYSEDNIQINEFTIYKDENMFINIKECIIRVCILLFFILKDESLYNIFNNKNNVDKSFFILNNIKKINEMF
jgi:hypothetical protein